MKSQVYRLVLCIETLPHLYNEKGLCFMNARDITFKLYDTYYLFIGL